MIKKSGHILNAKFEESILFSKEEPNIKSLALRIYHSSSEVAEPQRSRILERLPETVFISHTSLDDQFIKGADNNSESLKEGSIWWISGERFHDPFYHSLKTGGAEGYERIVGLSLLASKRVLIIWSANAARSDYVRAELLIAVATAKQIAAYVIPKAPTFPMTTIPLIYDLSALRLFLNSW